MMMKRVFHSPLLLFLVLMLTLLFIGCQRSDFPSPASWKVLHGSHPLPHFRDIACITPSDGLGGQKKPDVFFIAGFDGIIYKSNDGGKNWTWKQVQGQENLYALYFDNEHCGWVAGWGGSIYRTLNGGQTWQRCKSGTTHRITSMTRSDAEHLWAVGDDGLLLLSSDGYHFTQQPIPAIHGFRCISLGPDGPGIIIGYQGEAWITQDHGSTWHIIESLKQAKSDLYGCASNSRGIWVAGAFGLLLHSSDLGRTWQQCQIKSRAYLRSLEFITDEAAIVCGYGVILHSLDQGLNWHKLPATVPYQFLAGTLDSDNRIWIVGEYGALYHSSPPYAEWSGPHLGLGILLRDMTFVEGTDEIYAVGNKGTIMYSNDLGAHWHYQFLTPSNDLTALLSMPSNQIIIAGARGSLWSSGPDRTWVYHPLKDKRDIEDLAMRPNGEVWLCGQDGLLARSSSPSWEIRPTRTTVDLNSIAFHDNARGIIIGNDGLILTTHDGGSFFLGNYTGLENNLKGLSLLDDSVHLVGEAGLLMNSLSAYHGSSWNSFNLPLPINGNGIIELDDKSLYICSSGGFLFPKSRGEEKLKISKFYQNYDLYGFCKVKNLLFCYGENGFVTAKKISSTW